MILIIIFGNLNLYSQTTGAVSGKITDSDRNKSLPGARITIDDKRVGSVSDKNGYFTILGVPAGKHIIKVNYIGYLPFTTEVDVVASKSVFVNVELKSGTIKKDEVIVLGESLKGQAKALNSQKNRLQISNIVSSDQVGRFPDANVGDAMKRIPGITVQYDQGEARFGLVRGTAARLNSISINGERIPSAEAETRVVQLDLVPSDMIQTIEVNKTLTPDMDADAIGGSINLITKGAPNNLRFSATAGSGYSPIRSKPIWTASATAGQRFLDGKFGIMLSGSYDSHDYGSDNIEAEWDKTDAGKLFISDFQSRRYDLLRVRRSFSAGLDFKINNNNHIFFNSIYNDRDDWENRYRLRYRFDKSDDDGVPDSEGIVRNAETIRETKGGIGNDINDFARLEDQKAMNFSLNGNHLFSNYLKVNWSANWAKASEERPNERYIAYRNKSAVLIPDITNSNKPKATFLENTDDLSNWKITELTEQKQYTEDIDLNARLDFELPVMYGENSSFLKFGGRYRGKDKNRDNNFFEYSPLDEKLEIMTNTQIVDMSDDNFLAGDYRVGNFTSKEYLGNMDINNPALFEKTDVLEEWAGSNFDAKEDIIGGYIMYTQNIGREMSFIIGGRIENTSLEYTANEYDVDEGTVNPVFGDDSYIDILPAIHYRYNVSDDLVLRVAWTNTLARANYFDLAPYRIIITEDNELSEGNPGLEPTKSMNLDFIAENYFESVGIISGGFFYKSIDNYIFNYTQRDYTDSKTSNVFDKYTQPRNGGTANIYGFEAAFQRQLDFLPSFLRNLGIYLNYTFTNSEVEGIPLEGRENEKTALPGTAENMLNASLFYETSKLTLRVSLNYTTNYIDEYGDEAFYDRYYDNQLFLDFNGSYAINNQFRVFVEYNNITNQPLRYFQGVSDRVMQEEFYNSRINAGIKFDM